MRKGLCLALALALLLCGCGIKQEEAAEPVPPTQIVQVTEEPQTLPPETIPEETETLPEETETIPEETQTVPEHSEYYLPDYTARQITEYFEEIVLRMEYSDGDGNVALVQKWQAPIIYRIYGEATEADIEVLETLFTQLNGIPGFPGIYEAAPADMENLSIYFSGPEEFTSRFFEVVGGEDAYGAVQFWYYTDTNEIYSAQIGYRTDIDQQTRTSVLLEEIINMLGTSDTELREDSIVYQYSNENTALSDVDWVLVKLLYDQAIRCGMDYESCRAVIEELYY